MLIHLCPLRAVTDVAEVSPVTSTTKGFSTFFSLQNKPFYRRAFTPKATLTIYCDRCQGLYLTEFAGIKELKTPYTKNDVSASTDSFDAFFSILD